MFSTVSETEIIIYVTFILLSANACNSEKVNMHMFIRQDPAVIFLTSDSSFVMFSKFVR